MSRSESWDEAEAVARRQRGGAMKTLLVLDSSARVTRSVTRQLAARFRDAWLAAHSDGHVVHRDLGQSPAPFLDEDWIAAAFSGQSLDPALAWSEAILADIEAADLIVLGIPIYNFGMPASVKAMFDQIVRVGRTFDFTGDAENPYRPLLRSRPVVVIESAGDGGMFPGGARHHLNFLEPHLETLFGFIGLSDLTFVRVGYEEAKDERWERSLAEARSRVDELARARTAEAPLSAA